MRSRRERFEAITERGRISGIFLTVFFWLFVIVVALYLIDSPWITWSYLILPVEVRWIGFGFGVVAVPLVWWAHRTLGEYFSYALEVKGGHRLVTSGPYSRVRHPVYTFHILFSAGMALLAANWLLLLFWVISIPVAYQRMLTEEKMMIDRFGDEYIDYMKQTGRLVPRMSFRSDS
ncbi:MAG: isoprenylcysteine carboxylmethyltransferase family protein [Candidatus Thorarchaeota archaeon]